MTRSLIYGLTASVAMIFLSACGDDIGTRDASIIPRMDGGSCWFEPDQIECSGTCVNPDTDVDHCGACDNPCTAGPNQSSTCIAGSCGFSCDVGFADCNDDPADGCEVDLQADESHCGSCGNACSAPANATAACTDRLCEVICNDGYRLIGSECEVVPTVPTGVSAGARHTCAALSNGQIQCWGYNYEGGLLGTATSERCTVETGTFLCSTTPVTVASPAEVRGPYEFGTDVQVSVGGYFSCALRATGQVECWGSSGYGQLGRMATDELPTSNPAPVSGISTATAISTGGRWACAVLAGGQVQCWGYNQAGELGATTAERCSILDREPVACSTTPVPVWGIADATAISSGSWHTCAVLSSGQVRCWGDNPDGQLGDGTSNPSMGIPVTVVGVNTATAIAAGRHHTCALLSSGEVKCWGRNNNGQLGDGGSGEFSLAVTVSGIRDAVAISAGNYHTCAVLLSGQVQCWGQNYRGQLGDGVTRGFSTMPVPVAGIDDAVAIAGGNYHSCAVLGHGQVWCWGRNDLGQLGDGSRNERDTPTSAALGR